jgi:hypothetical protein
MSYSELRRYLAPRFEIELAWGFNGSLHHTLDTRIDDPAFARAWAALFLDQPELAASLIIMARRRDDYACEPPSAQSTSNHQSHASNGRATGRSCRCTSADRRLTADGERGGLTFEFEGTDVLVFFWAHPWSGRASLDVDGRSAPTSSSTRRRAGFKRMHVSGLAPGPIASDRRRRDRARAEPRQRADLPPRDRLPAFGSAGPA